MSVKYITWIRMSWQNIAESTQVLRQSKSKEEALKIEKWARANYRLSRKVSKQMQGLEATEKYEIACLLGGWARLEAEAREEAKRRSK